MLHIVIHAMEPFPMERKHRIGRQLEKHEQVRLSITPIVLSFPHLLLLLVCILLLFFFL